VDPSQAERSRKTGFGAYQDLTSWVVVIPVLDEALALPGLLAELAAEPGLLERVVFVDNGSRDGSRELLERRGARVVDEPHRGYGYACLTGAGVTLARGAGAVVFMEGDGSDDPRDLPLIVEPVLRGEADLMIGVRRPAAGGMPAHQRLGNRLAAVAMRCLFGLEVSDNGPFRAIDADLLRRLAIAARPFAWTTEMLVKAHLAGARIGFVQTRYRRRAGRSKIAGTVRGTVGAFCGIFVTLVRLWLPLRLRRGHPRPRRRLES
jgi:glycosyltransferase involved in cell wall biosynthesis